MAHIVKLNVGGYIYTTSRSTLTRYPNSMLGAMFSGRMTTLQDQDGNYWIDRNGEMFRYVLDFLRQSRLFVPDDFQDFELLESEADFYQLPELIKAVKSKRGKEGRSKPANDRGKRRFIVVEYIKYGTIYANIRISGPPDAIQQLGRSLQRYSELIQYKNSDPFIYIPTAVVHVVSKPVLLQEIMNLGFRIHAMPQDGIQIIGGPVNKNPMWFIEEEQI